MQFYISTGGFNLKPTQSIKKLLSHNIRNIEISGGKYENKLIKKILNFNKIKINVHNYMPFYKKPFVFNLASNNKKILDKSIAMAKKSIDLVSLNKSKFYTFHAGFLFDPKINMLGDKKVPKKIFNRKLALKRFVKNSLKLYQYAKKKNVTLLIENNVVTKNQFTKYNYIPLMSEIDETLYTMHKFKNKIGLLLDVGHLNVSSQTLRFSREKYVKKLNKFIHAYHISNNNGLYDQNLEFNKRSWFWKFLKKNVKFCSVEVYSSDIKKLKKLFKITKEKLS